MNKFSDKTIEELGYYVYSLTDPRNNKIFYAIIYYYNLNKLGI